MLTHQQIDILESAWEILDQARNCKDFNESHDLTLSDGCRVISEFLDYQQDRYSSNQHQTALSTSIFSLESFNGQ